MTKIIHVHLIFSRKDRYFGSISAIFGPEGFTEEEVGIKKSTLLHSGLREGFPLPTKKAIITQSHLIRGGKSKNETED